MHRVLYQVAVHGDACYVDMVRGIYYVDLLISIWCAGPVPPFMGYSGDMLLLVS